MKLNQCIFKKKLILLMKNYNFSTVPVTLFFTLLFVSIFNLFNTNILRYLYINSFNRTMGMALKNNMSIGKMIGILYLCYFIIAPIIFMVFFYLFSHLYNEHKLEKDCLRFINYFSIVSLSPIIMLFLNYVEASTYITTIIFSVVIFISLFLYLIFLKKFIKFNIFKLILLISFEFQLFFYLFCNTSIRWFYLYFLIVFVMTIVCIKNKSNEIFSNIFSFSFVFFIYGILIISIFLEFTNILNQHNVFVINKIVKCRIIFFSLFLFGFILLMFLTKLKIKIKIAFDKYYYIALILGLGFINSLTQLQFVANSDLFESANAGLMVNDFLKYNKIPIIESYDAHMLSNSIWGIFYGVLNKDNLGAIFIPYINYSIPIFLLIFYKVLKEFYDDDFAFFVILLFPYNTPYFYLDFSMLCIISLLYCVKKNDLKAYIMYMLSIVLINLYRLDFGAVFTIATIIALLITNKIFELKLKIKLFFGVMLSFIFLCTALFSVLCIAKHIDPILRLKEIIKIVNSNVNWAYGFLGDPAKFGFMATYIIIPSISIFVFYTIAINLFNKKSMFMKKNQFIIILVLLLVFIFNLSRGIVRHSFAEERLYFFASTIILAFSLCISLYHKKNNFDKVVFMVSLTFSSILIPIFLSNTKCNTNNLLQYALSKNNVISTFNNDIYEKVDRVILDRNFEDNISPIINTLNKIIREDETYVDFTNQSLLYAISNKEKPIYINQSPGLMSGEFMQEQYINQIKSSKKQVIFALMPSDINFSFNIQLDGIMNSYRYYKVSEFISKNFKPIIKCGIYYLWCLNDKYDEVLTRVSSDNYDNVNLDFYEDNNPNAKDYYLNTESILTNADSYYFSKVYEIYFDYESNIEGNVYLFYTSKKGEEFSNDKSFASEINENLELKFLVPLTSQSKVKLHVPFDDKFTIKEIHIKEIPSYEQIKDENYGDTSILHTYDLGYIPYIWGMYDAKKSYLNLEIKDCIYKQNDYYSIDIKNIDKEKGNYILIEGSFEIDGNCQIVFGEKSASDFESLSIFNFSIKKGENQRLIIRVSSDFNWYLGKINSFKISGDINEDNISIRLLEGD